MFRPGSRSWIVAVVSLLVMAIAGGAGADSKLRIVVIAPFDATALDREEQWMGEGVAQILALGLAQNASIVQIERSRLRASPRGHAASGRMPASSAASRSAETRWRSCRS